MCFQSYALWPHMSVRENVAFGLETRGVAREKRAKRVEDVLRLVRLEKLGDRKPNELSGGQQQRVALARAMVLEPKVLLFDEPLSNLDARLRRRVRDEIRGLQQSLGLTVVYVTHDQSEALAISDRIIVMNQARIAQDGTPRTLYEAPADRFVVNFIGEASILPVLVVAVAGDRATVQAGATMLSLPRRGQQAGKAELAIRPHAVHLSADADGPGVLRGTVRRAVYGGDHMEYDVVVDGFVETIFVVDTNVTAPWPEGGAVRVTLSEAGLSMLPAHSA